MGSLAAPAKIALRVQRGQDLAINFVVTDTDGKPIDITGWALSFFVYTDSDGKTAAGVDKTTGAGTITIADQTVSKGKCTVLWYRADTFGGGAPLTGTTYWVVLGRVDAGSVTPLAEGPLAIRPAAVQ